MKNVIISPHGRLVRRYWQHGSADDKFQFNVLDIPPLKAR